MIILLQADWYFSMNAGEDCESQVIGVFDTEDEYHKYLTDNHITDRQFNRDYLMGEEPYDNQWLSWYYTERFENETVQK